MNLDKNFKQELSTQWFYRFLANKFFNNGINFTYTYTGHFLLGIRIHFHKNFDLAKSTSSKNHEQIKILISLNPFKFQIYWICSLSGITSNWVASIQTLVISNFYVILN